MGIHGKTPKKRACVTCVCVGETITSLFLSEEPVECESVVGFKKYAGDTWEDMGRRTKMACVTCVCVLGETMTRHCLLTADLQTGRIQTPAIRR